jgi:hypothetical protein
MRINSTVPIGAAIAVVSAVVAAAAGPRPQGVGAPAATSAVPTFSRDVAPIFYKHCVECHRPGEIAPMSLLTYKDARPWARAIQTRVSDGVMPPWHADAQAGTFANERKLTTEEKDTIGRWEAGGAPEGNPRDLPPAPTFADGWQIGTPDAVFQMSEDYAVPPTGTIQYEYFYIPTNFTDRQWLQAIEVRPGNRKLVHHVLVYYQAPPDEPQAAPALRLDPEQNRTPPPLARPTHPQQRGARRLIATYAPGTSPQVFPAGTALRLPPGGVIELQMHYTANGTAGTDRTRVGMVFAKEPPAQEIRASQFLNTRFTIPAGAADHRVDAEVEFQQDALLWGLFPHTHVRGKRWNYVLALPDGSTKPLLSVPKYDFNWQTYYMFTEPLAIPKGARILSSAWYDNSTANKWNPDPKLDVQWGDQTWEEMQYTGLLYTVKTPAGSASAAGTERSVASSR